MIARAQQLLARLGRLEKILLLLLVLYLIVSLAQPSGPAGLWLAIVLTGFLLLWRLARQGVTKAIWRLRNRLIVAYIFIAVVPVLLVLALVGIAAYAVIGQTAVYLINTELSRRSFSLQATAEALARAPEANREEISNRMTAMLQNRFTEFEVLIHGRKDVHIPPNSKLEPPPESWKSANGLVVKDGRLFLWAHVAAPASRVTLISPVSHRFLVSLVPNLGDVNFVNYTARSLSSVPPPVNLMDLQVAGIYPVIVPSWESPSSQNKTVLIVYTRLSAVLGTVFGQKLEWGEVALGAFAAVALLFLIVEMASLMIGIQLTRTITGAVHELYQGTQHVKEGDFAHRIPVHGNDQLAELGASFNTMTENLGRLIIVAKEKERLQSELEIAREVQNQLFPKNAPTMRSMRISGVCNPARMVSGDYYDFIRLSDVALAFAIGDVAGKGISAALLMAAIQSTMRTQLTSEIPLAAAAGNGGTQLRVSTAGVVSQLNRQLYANTAPEKYATFFFALYDDTSNTLTYTNAGHLPPILIRDGGAQLLEVTGTVVGAFPTADYEEKQLRLDVDDMLVAYTDGIVEPENVYGEMFGEERLTEMLLKYSNTDSSELIARAMEAVVHWTGSTELQDDMTMVIARRI